MCNKKKGDLTCLYLINKIQLQIKFIIIINYVWSQNVFGKKN